MRHDNDIRTLAKDHTLVIATIRHIEEDVKLRIAPMTTKFLQDFNRLLGGSSKRGARGARRELLSIKERGPIERLKERDMGLLTNLERLT